MVTPKRRSISLPITLSAVAVGLTITMLVGWILVIAQNMDVLYAFIGNVGLLVGGIVSFAMIITVLVAFTVFLVREISEVRKQTSFIDSVTHELKTPLASLRLAAETLARRELPNDRREQLRVMMLQDVSRLIGLVDGILDASRLLGVRREAGDIREVELDELVAAITQEAIRRHHVDPDCVTIDIATDLVLFVDPHAMRTIVSNLIDNAIKYSDAPPNVHVSAHKTEDGRHIELSVRDQGIGIGKGDLKRIFQRFYRVPEEAVRARHGTGLGLFVVAALVKGVGGKIEALSPGIRQGTTIRVLFPQR